MKNIVIILSLLTIFSCNKTKKEKPIVQDIKELVFASGQLEWDDSYNLTAQTDGVLQNVTFEVGTTVNKGNIIATIDNKTNEISTQIAQEQLVISNENLTANSPALLQLQQNIQFAESKYQQDKAQEERYKRLYESQSVAKVEYENMQLNSKNSLSNLNALKKQANQILQNAKLQQISTKGQVQNSKVLQNYNRIVVTESGTIIKKLKTTGDYVRKGDVIATIANSNKLEAILNVDENSIGKIKIGQTVYVSLNSNKDDILNGKISEILSAFDEKTQSFICKVIFDKSIQNSIFGTQLEANILVGEKKNALLIPRSYVGFGNKVNVKGKDEYVIIKPGIISTEYVEVLSGISKNDVILPLKL
ncbi:HlyD family efflux transporter periplasmic adaptor subunit [Empedobacter brevis]|uniref:HlyD family efflux transporter periplasmic adaptor subunit n=2 Tax=Empedobacter TaxID=59734 RepID=A0AAW7DRD5_9FLAO|nr:MULTISPECIES: HlyD family efflux transporter periplasmic adaptor subunit [Empedobacter]MDM1074321.1 HlyD family efflux transporter periplasmic adaptor subunit [Empedobacter brevis]MDM1552871.1 HlyD family efflux transporter periplasmic adaptor subunit [Empedobacter falsenii]